MTRNTGTEPLVLLCFFAEPDVTQGHHRVQELLKCVPARKSTLERACIRESLHHVQSRSLSSPGSRFRARRRRRAGEPRASPITRPTDPRAGADRSRSDALVIPAVGPKLAAGLFEGTKLKLVQVTGAGVDRLDQAAMTRSAFPSPTCRAAATARWRNTSSPPRRCCCGASPGPTPRSRPATTRTFRARMIADNLAGHRRAAGRAGRLRHHRPRGGAGDPGAWAPASCFYDPAPVDAAAAAALDARAVSLDELLATLATWFRCTCRSCRRRRI